MRVPTAAVALVLVLAASARADDEELLTAGEFTSRVAAAVRTAHDLTRDAAGAEARGRALPEAVLHSRMRQLVNDLGRMKAKSVQVDGALPVRIDTSWIETRLYTIHAGIGPDQIKAEASAIEQCLRTLGTEVAALDRTPAEVRAERLRRLERDRRGVLDLLSRPEYLAESVEGGRTGWADEVAAFLERLFRVEIPGWATRGSEVFLILVVGAGVLATLEFIRRRRRGVPKPTPIGRPQGTSTVPPTADDAAAYRAACDRGDVPAAVSLACRRLLAATAGRHGPERWLARTHGELLDAWRRAVPADESARLAAMVDLHEHVWYRGRPPADALAQADRLLGER